MRLRAALGLSRAEFNDLSLRECTQFAFAKGEQTVMARSGQAEAIYKGIDAAFADEPGQVFETLWTEMMTRVNYQVQLNDEDYIAHNDRMAQQFSPLKP